MQAKKIDGQVGTQSELVQSNSTVESPTLVDYGELGSKQSSQQAVEAALLRARESLGDPTKTPLLDPTELGPEDRIILNAKSADQLYKSFVVSGQAITLSPEAIEFASDANPGSDVIPSAKSTNENLLHLTEAAKTYAAERGINSLFITLGEISFVSKSGREVRAPLLLVPVNCTRASATSQYELKFSEEPIEINPGLTYLIEQEFGSSLPNFAPMSDQTPGEYFKCLTQALTTVGLRFELNQDMTGLANYSLANFYLLKELDPKSWPQGHKPWDNPIIRGMFDEGFYDPGSKIAKGVPIDSAIDPENYLDILSSDSSQMRVIHDARQGQSIVVEGPPGTGKSTTIANLIANAVADGKKILVVSEKAAALEVTRRMLDSAGLGDLALSLHGAQAITRTVIEDIKRTSALGRPIDALRDNALQQWRIAQGRLNDHVVAMTGEVGHSGFSAYETLEQLFSFRQKKGVELLDLDGVDMRSWTKIDYDRALTFVSNLQDEYARRGMPGKHPFLGCMITSDELPAKVELDQLFSATEQSARKLAAVIEQVLTKLKIKFDPNPEQIKNLTRILNFISEYDTQNGTLLEGVPLDPATWRANKHGLSEALNSAKELTKIRSELNGVVKPDAWQIPQLAKIRAILKSELSFQDAAPPQQIILANQCLDDLFMADSKHLTRSAQLKILDQLISAQSLSHSLSSTRSAFGELLGPNWIPRGQIDEKFWRKLDFVVSYVDILMQASDQVSDFSAIVQIVRNPQQLWQLADAGELSKLIELLAEFEQQRDLLLDTLKYRNFENQESIKSKPLVDQVKLTMGWHANLGRLAELSEYNRIVRQAEFPGRDALLTKAENWSYSPTRLVDSLKFSWFSGLAEDFLTYTPIAGEFRDATHQQYIDQFIEADRQLLAQNGSVVAKRHWEQIPRLNLGGEYGALVAEMRKDAGYLPLAELFTKAGRALQAIKPVMLMSPQTVAKYLAQGGLQFDLVIFDEGSQIRPLKAVGPMLRAKQVVAFGDSNQLAPTTYYEQTRSTDPTPVTNENEENILQVLTHCGLPKRQLQWHYRSKVGGLVHISNQEFYQDGLIVFPDSHRGSGSIGIGLTCHQGGSTVDGVNRTEVERVAAAVEQQILDNPFQSVGVVTLTEGQAKEITVELERRRAVNPMLDRLISANTVEPFFVRSIEQVQGDERDKIIISLVYGRDAQGKISYDFGPLTKVGGERRFNVMVTRARLGVELVASFEPEELDLTKTKSNTLRILKNYMAFAKNGKLEQPDQAGTFSVDALQSSIKLELERQGLKVETNVGLGSAKVDLAVIDPADPARFILGIMTDGKQYQSLKAARDRERLLPDALKARGWNLCQVWTLDWFEDQATQVQKIVTAVRAASKIQNENRSVPNRIASGGNGLQRESRTLNAFEVISNYDRYELAQISFDNPQESSSRLSDLKKALVKVIEVESPIHQDDAFRRIAQALEMPKATEELRAILEIAQADLIKERLLVRRGEFLYSTGDKPITARDRSDIEGPGKSIARIAPEELDLALEIVLRNTCGVSQSELVRGCLDLLGFKFNQTKAQEIIEARLAQAVQSGWAEVVDGQVVILRNS